MAISDIFNKVEAMRDSIISSRAELRGLSDSLAVKFRTEPLFPERNKQLSDLLIDFSYSIQAFFGLSDIDNTSMGHSFLKLLKDQVAFFYSRERRRRTRLTVTPTQIHDKLDEIIRTLEHNYERTTTSFGRIQNYYLGR
jgi:hypothetical protein